MARGNQADLHHDIDAENAFDLQTISSDTTTSGEIIDMSGKVNIDFVIRSGVITDGAYTIVLQQDELIGFASPTIVPAGNLLGALPTFALTDDQTVKRVGFFPAERFCRMQIVSTATTTGGLFSAVAVFNPTITLTT